MARAQFNHILTKNEVDEIESALTFYYPQIVGETGRVGPGKFSTKNFKWSGRVDFSEDIRFLTDIDLINVKEGQLYQSLKIVDQSLRKLTNTNPVESNRPTKEQLETFEKEAEERRASQQKAVEEAKTNLDAAIKKQQEIQEALLNKKIYAKVEITKEAPPPNESTINFINEAKSHPASFEKDLAENIKAKITPALAKTLTEEEIDIIAGKTAFDTVSAINNFPAQSSANTRAAILGALAKDSKVISKVIPTKSAADLLQNSANESRYFVNSTQLSKNILSSINPNLATAVFGMGPENLNVTFFEQPVEGYTHEVDLGKFNEGHINLLESQTKVFDNISSFAGDEAKRLVMGQARNFLDSQILKLPADGAISGLYNSELGQQILNFAGLGKVAPLGEGFLSESFFGSFVQQIPGGTAFFEGVGNFFGIDLISVAAPTEIAEATLLTTEGTALVGEAALVEGGTLLAEGATGIVAAEGLTVGVEAGLVGAEATAAVAAAPATLGLSLVIGAIITAVTAAVGWIAKKINWAKIKENLIAISGGMLAAGLLLFPNTLFGTALSVTGGLGLVGGVMGGGLSTLGASLSSIGTGVAGFFGALGTAFVGAVATPILVTLLVFPVVVALILFIINSGAYVVPPSAGGVFGSPIGCSTEIANRAGVIANNLQLGFNNYYNKSPDYPELWNAALFAQNPNTPESQIGAEGMLWCNYMATKSFLAINEVLPFPLPTMISYFKSEQGKWADGNYVTYNDVCPGDAVFFYNSLDPIGSVSHVGIVAGVSSDGITTDESNAPYKPGWFYPTDSSGHFEAVPLKTSGGQNFSINIIGFGKP